MNKEKMTGISIMLFGGVISLGQVYTMYGWLGAIFVLATVGMGIFLIAISEEEENE